MDSLTFNMMIVLVTVVLPTLVIGDLLCHFLPRIIADKLFIHLEWRVTRNIRDMVALEQKMRDSFYDNGERQQWRDLRSDNLACRKWQAKIKPYMMD